MRLDSVILDAGPTVFGSGMIYVGLSRVTRISGLYLIDHAHRKIKCDPKAVSEYNRLRSEYTDLGDLSSAKANRKRNAAVKNTKSTDREMSVTKKSTVCPKRQKLNQTATCKRSDTILRKTNRQKMEKEKTRSITNVMENASDKCKMKPNTQTEMLSKKDPDKGSRETNSSGLKNHIIESVSGEVQRSVCAQLNLMWSGYELNTSHQSEVTIARMIENSIYKVTRQQVKVNIYHIMGDGNCLFRALSLGITGTQSQHRLIRYFIVNHMMNVNIRDEFCNIYGSYRRRCNYEQHVATMQTPGQWGTEMEVIAAANLLQCSIVCLSNYNSEQYCFQHFPPHFVLHPTCSNECLHDTIYLVNSSGRHYNLAVVSIDDLEE